MTPDGVEIALSPKPVAELSASLQGPAPFRDYHIVEAEAKQLKFSEKAILTLLKEKHASNYAVGSDIRIDPIDMDTNYAVSKKKKFCLCIRVLTQQ